MGGRRGREKKRGPSLSLVRKKGKKGKKGREKAWFDRGVENVVQRKKPEIEFLFLENG